MGTKACGLKFALYLNLIVLGKLVYGELEEQQHHHQRQEEEEVRVTPLHDVCAIGSVSDFLLGFRQTICLANAGHSFPVVGVIEGNDESFQKTLQMVHKNRDEHAAFVFYASWCPFSRTFRQKISALSYLYPSIPHLAIEESSIKPSILSKYGVHGFPALFLINSSMIIRYQGSRSLRSLVAFYNDVTGIKPAPHKSTWISQTNEEKQISQQESYTFNWTRFPVNMLGQDAWLALATGFLLLRLFYFLYPSLCEYAQYIWSGRIRNASLGSLWGHHPHAYLARAIQLFKSLKEPCKRSNLQEGAMNARAWASKSLASVSIGDASTSRAAPVREHH